MPCARRSTIAFGRSERKVRCGFRRSDQRDEMERFCMAAPWDDIEILQAIDRLQRGIFGGGPLTTYIGLTRP